MKVVLNKCFGGFGVSKEVYKELGIKWDGYGYLRNEDFNIKSDDYMKYRFNKKLIKAIEKIGLEKSSGKFAKLEIIDVPNDLEYEWNEYDGVETIHEKHKSW